MGDGSLVPALSPRHESSASVDEALSNNSQYLYVLNSGPFPSFAVGKIDEFKVNADGTLTPIGATLPFEGTSSGLAAW